MQRKELVIQKLREVRDKIPEMKQKDVPYLTTAEFDDWKNTGIKWLKQGQPHTDDELFNFRHLFATWRIIRTRGPSYTDEDQWAYENDCDRAVSILNSAIENLENDLVVTESPTQEAIRGGRERSKYGGVTITDVDTLVIGEGNILNLDKSITISDFLNVLEREIEAKVTDAEQKKGLLQKLKEISQNPAVNTVLGQALGTFLRGYFRG